jgi:hypothetical protein
MLSATPRLNRWIASARQAGFYEALTPGRDFVLLGLITEGGQGLATADDRRFIAAIEGSPEADAARQRQQRLEELTLANSQAAAAYTSARRRGQSREDALLEVSDQFDTRRELEWPKGGEIRVALEPAVRSEPLTEEEIREGIASGPCWVPFEKGEGAIAEADAVRWRRDNPLVIDWSPEAVELLRARAASDESYRKPRLQNEQMWGKPGITWNSLGRNLRARDVPAGSIFGHNTPVIRPLVDWLSSAALLALLNSRVPEFVVRTFLGQLVRFEVGDLRRLPIPVLTPDGAQQLDGLGRAAVAAKERLDREIGSAGELAEIEREVEICVHDLYGFQMDADLWVVR